MKMQDKRSYNTSMEDVRVGKRKAVADEEGPTFRQDPKKIRQSLDALRGSCNTSVEDVRVGKRKAVADEEGPTFRQDPKKNQRPKTKKKRRRKLKKTDYALRVEFRAKYKQECRLGQRRFGIVFGGYRIADNLPVAIKHITKETVHYDVDGTGKQLPVEVAIMLKLADKTSRSVGMSAPVSLLDWYDLNQELILVMERPIPAEDLCMYIDGNRGYLPEQEAKIILKQLVDAAIDLEEENIFHRDIKSENILIETSSDVPRVRLIDFGLSCVVKRRAS